MARKSRKKNISIRDTAPAVTGIKVFRTVIYLRLSREDEESYSIQNQRALLESYIKEHDELQLCGECVDYGVSGTDFERPDFSKMITDMKNGVFDCILVKDLSRFGRSYLEAGEYLEEIFPFYNVRFISVTDNYDNLKCSGADEGLIIPLKNIINDVYAKDISQKIGTSLRIKQQRGEFIGSYPPYGYCKDPDNRHHLLIDENTANTVKQIFEWKLQGIGNGKIARRLNERKILSPMQYRYEMGWVYQECYKDSPWLEDTVKHILDNTVYVGDMAQGTEYGALCRGLKSRKIPREQWIVVKNTHQAIISREMYENVRKVVDERTVYSRAIRAGSKVQDEMEDCFRGLLYCGECGNRLYLRRTVRTNKAGEKNTYYNYFCKYRAIPHELKGKHRYPGKQQLEAAVENVLKVYMQTFLTERGGLVRKNGTPDKRENIEADYQEAEKKINNLNSRIRVLYKDLVDGIINEREYIQIRKKMQNDIAVLEKQRQELSEAKEGFEAEYMKKLEEKIYVDKYKDFKGLTPEIVQAFIRKITVFDASTIEFEFRFSDQFSKVG